MVELTPDVIIERLCKLQQEVHDVVGYDSAADCFCKKGGFWGCDNYDESAYRNDGTVLVFIENAVRTALDKYSE